MTKIEFIAFLCSYGLIVALTPLIQKRVRLPDHVERAKPNKSEILGGGSRLYCKFMFCVTFLVSIFGIAGFFGMFFFWKPAPWIFGAGVIGKLLIYPKTLWSVSSGWENFAGELEALLGGAILALALIGPANQLFT